MPLPTGYVSVRAVGALTCLLVIAAGVIAAVSWNRQRPVGSHPDGIVSLSPALTNLLFQMGAGEEVSGISDYSRLPNGESRLVVGDNVRINRELALWLAPRWIVYQQNKTDTLRRLEEDGVRLQGFQIETVGDIKETLRGLGRIARKGDANAAIAEIDADLEAVRRIVGNDPSRRSVLLIMGRLAAGKGTFLDELIYAAGGQNVVTLGGYRMLSQEDILPMAPQVILDVAEELEHAPAAAVEQRRKSWDWMKPKPPKPAPHICVLTDGAITIPDANVGRTAMEFARRIHPEAFEARGPASQPESQPN